MIKMNERTMRIHKKHQHIMSILRLYQLLSMIIISVRSQCDGDIYPIVHGLYFSQFGNTSSQDYAFVPEMSPSNF